MTLKEALKSMSAMDGWLTFKPSQVYSILSDLGVFQTNPRIRLALKRALHYNYWEMFIAGIFSPSELSKLNAKLLYDGFSESIVNEILSIFLNEEQSNIKNETIKQNTSYVKNEIKNNTNTSQDTQCKPEFMGITLGESIDRFSNILLNRGYKKNGVTTRYDRDVLSFNGPFANLKDAYIYIEYSTDTNVVYGVVVSFIHRDIKTFNKVLDLYEGKYGRLVTSHSSPQVGKNKDSVVTKTAKLSDDGRIEISFSLLASKITISYISNSLWAIEEPKILNRKQKKIAKYNVEKQAKINQIYNDI